MTEESYAHDSGRRTRNTDPDTEQTLALKALMNEERIHSLEQLINVKIASLEAVITAKAIAQAEAITKAERAADGRFASVNEFRGQLSDTIQQFATKESVASGTREQRTINDALLVAVHLNETRLSNLEGRIVAYVGAGTTLATVLGALFSWFGHTLH
jgi:CHASE3 domain sensor protein